MRNNDNEVDNRIAGSKSNAGTQLTNADTQRRNVLWAREAEALRSGDMAVEHVRLNLIKELSGYINDRVGENHSVFRDYHLTLARINSVKAAIQILEAADFARRCQGANPCNENRELFQQMATTLGKTLEDIRRQHAQYSGRHHVHISGSRIPFFGSGSFFQSGAENAVLSAIAELNCVYRERTGLLNSHANHNNEYHTFVTQLRL